MESEQKLHLTKSWLFDALIYTAISASILPIELKDHALTIHRNPVNGGKYEAEVRHLSHAEILLIMGLFEVLNAN